MTHSTHDAIIEATRGEEAVIAFDSDHRENIQVCRQLAKLIAEREQDAVIAGCKASTSVVVWEGAKGIDDAVLASVRLRVLSVAEWSRTLTGKPLDEIKDLWAACSFAPVND